MADRFVFYSSFYEAIKGLSDAERLQVFDAICAYALQGAEPDNLDPVPTIIFTMAKPQIDANIKRAEGGGKGGRPSKIENKKPKVSKTENQRLKKEKTIGFEKEKAKVSTNNYTFSSFYSSTFSKFIFDYKNTSEKEDCAWEKLFCYWVQEKKGAKYKREQDWDYAFGKLQELTGGDYEFAKEVIQYCLMRDYEGFFNKDGLFYKPAAKTADEKFIL